MFHLALLLVSCEWILYGGEAGERPCQSTGTLGEDGNEGCQAASQLFLEHWAEDICPRPDPSIEQTSCFNINLSKESAVLGAYICGTSKKLNVHQWILKRCSLRSLLTSYMTIVRSVSCACAWEALGTGPIDWRVALVDLCQSARGIRVVMNLFSLNLYISVPVFSCMFN